MLSQQELKQQAADAALEFVEQVAGPDAIIGVGTGSTADLFIDGLAVSRAASPALWPAPSAARPVWRDMA